MTGNEESLWADFEEYLRDEYYPHMNGDPAIQALADKMNRFLRKVCYRMATLCALWNLNRDGVRVRSIEDDEGNKETALRLEYGNRISGILVLSAHNVCSSCQWHGQQIGEQRLTRFTRQTLTACNLDIEHILRAHLESMREEANAIQQFVDTRREAQHDLPF